MGLGLDVQLFDEDKKVIDMDSLARQTQQEEKRAMNNYKHIGRENSSSEKREDFYEEEEATFANFNDVGDDIIN